MRSCRFLLVLILITLTLSSSLYAFDLSLEENKPEASSQRVETPDVILTESLDLFYEGNITGSFKLLNSVDEKFNWHKRKENLFTSFFKNTIEVIANDRIVPYEPWIYEMINVNTFKAIDSLVLNDIEHARVEFNRAFVREEEAKEEFRREIEEQMRNLKRKKNKNVNQENVKKSLDFILSKYYSNLSTFKAYQGFLNPFTEYMGAIYFYSIGDYKKAIDHFKICYGIIKGKEPAEQFVASDFELAFNKLSSLKGKPIKKIWIVFLNGQIGQRVEKRIDLPLFLFTKKVLYSGLALPDLKEGKTGYPYISISFGSKTKKTKKLVDMDKLEKAEFKKRFQVIATRAIIRAIIFTIGQAVEKNKTGKIIIGGYQFIMNHADTRQWRNLPKEVQIASLNIPSNRRQNFKLLLYFPGSSYKKEFIINPKKNTLIIVSAPTREKVHFYKIEL